MSSIVEKLIKVSDNIEILSKEDIKLAIDEVIVAFIGDPDEEEETLSSINQIVTNITA